MEKSFIFESSNFAWLRTDCIQSRSLTPARQRLLLQQRGIPRRSFLHCRLIVLPLSCKALHPKSSLVCLYAYRTVSADRLLVRMFASSYLWTFSRSMWEPIYSDRVVRYRNGSYVDEQASEMTKAFSKVSFQNERGPRSFPKTFSLHLAFRVDFVHRRSCA